MKRPAHSAPSRTSTNRRLPRWLKRGLRAWARAARWCAGEPQRRLRAAASQALDTTLAAEGEEPLEEQLHQRRCGWFDSSQDLREGLCISEHEAQEAVCAQLPVMAWVQLQLSGWRPELEPALR